MRIMNEGGRFTWLASFNCLLEVFPIRYDLSKIATGVPEVITGQILDTPRTMLTEKQLVELALR
jgi:hypothetical protein